ADQICILEIQDSQHEAQWITDAPIDRDALALSISYWVTERHVLNSKELVVFSSRDGDVLKSPEVAEGIRRLDDFMRDIYLRLGGTLWHNEHIYWRLCWEAIGQQLPPLPGPDRPRSTLGNRFRWTGYDLDFLQESWQGGKVLLEDRLSAAPEPGSGK